MVDDLTENLFQTEDATKLIHTLFATSISLRLFVCKEIATP